MESNFYPVKWDNASIGPDYPYAGLSARRRPTCNFVALTGCRGGVRQYRRRPRPAKPEARPRRHATILA